MLLALRAFFSGLVRALTGWKSAFLLYLANLLFSAVVAVPIYALAERDLAATPHAQAFLGAYDPEFIADFLRGNAAAFSGAARATTVSAVFFALVYVFLLGGVLAALHDTRRPLTFTTFFSACGRYVFPFLRALVPAAAVTGLLVLANERAGAALDHLFEDVLQRRSSAALVGWTLAGKTAVFLALFVLLAVLPVQFARVRCVVEGERGMLKGYLRGLGLCLARPVAALGFFALSSGLLAGLFVLHHAFLARIDWGHDLRPLESLGWTWNPALPPWLLALVLGQATLLLAQLVFVQRAAGLLVIWREHAPEPVPRDPELIYASTPVVDAPAPRAAAKHRPIGTRRGAASAEDTTTGDMVHGL